MRSRSLTVLVTGLGLALILSSCAYHTQTTSGSQHLARYAGKETAPAAASSGTAWSLSLSFGEPPPPRPTQGDAKRQTRAP